MLQACDNFNCFLLAMLSIHITLKLLFFQLQYCFCCWLGIQLSLILNFNIIFAGYVFNFNFSLFFAGYAFNSLF